ncbi:MAG: type II toxin-antitoxin system VapC family toxin [Candidatus Limnocylindrales bacterium]
MILVDSNIPMYLIGAEHRNKHAARSALEAAIEVGERLVTDAEVLQEILHRYVAIDRREAIEPCTEALLGVVDEVFPVELEDIRRASAIVRTSMLSARDALHLAIMQRHGITHILTFDRAYQSIPGIVRLGG